MVDVENWMQKLLVLRSYLSLCLNTNHLTDTHELTGLVKPKYHLTELLKILRLEIKFLMYCV